MAGQSPLLQGLAIIAATFVLEDAATIATAMAVQDRSVGLPTGLIALYLGIVLGDLGLYGLGRMAAGVHRSSAWARRLLPPQRHFAGRAWLERNVLKVVFVARFLPGVRLPTYTTCGFLGASFSRFALAAIGATLIWTTLLFGVSVRLGAFMVAHLGPWRWVGTIGVIVVMMLAGRLAAKRAAP